MIQHISAVTFAVRDMARSIEFYRKLGFELQYGGDHAAFSSLQAGEAFVNLSTNPGYEHSWWGPIFRVDDVDAALPSKSSAVSSDMTSRRRP